VTCDKQTRWLVAIKADGIATDSGLCWPRKGLKRPGVITLRYGEAVPAGLPRREAETLIHRGINALERLD